VTGPYNYGLYLADVSNSLIGNNSVIQTSVNAYFNSSISKFSSPHSLQALFLISCSHQITLKKINCFSFLKKSTAFLFVNIESFPLLILFKHYFFDPIQRISINFFFFTYSFFLAAPTCDPQTLATTSRICFPPSSWEFCCSTCRQGQSVVDCGMLLKLSKFYTIRNSNQAGRVYLTVPTRA